MSVFGFGDLAFMGAVGGVAYDADAAAYIAAVEAADGQALEAAVKDAIDAFVRGCKADGIWSAIKASCILAGARTLNGALVPLVGPAPTSFAFIATDYDRKTGLNGDDNSKYLASNRNGNSDPQDNQHLSVFISSHANATDLNNRVFIGTEYDIAGSTVIARSSAVARGGYIASRSLTGTVVADTVARTGFHGISRSTNTGFNYRRLSVTTNYSRNSESPSSQAISVFRGGTGPVFADARLAFYSIGETLDLALLDARVTTLINAFGTAIA